ncbi:MAG TPA: sigma-70 family RNA polymerase sigma factor [Steroidobacteraceae bacterium]|jgi:RNA polymerase sigma-70 factor (ECF subfamily)|nr:sigma-70 family RNA polymerase sigma factor [Steroidobacteraceae bacterium]
MIAFSSSTDLPAGTAPEALETARDERYLEAAALYGASLERMARGYEADPSRRQDLLQEVHVAIWRSLLTFDGRCSLRTWVYRVAHFTATKHMMANRRVRLHEMHTLDEMPDIEDDRNAQPAAAQADSLQQLLALIEGLKPLDRQVILMYLEDFSAEAIGDVVGLSPGNIATKIHRIKKLLASMFQDRSGL